MQTFKELSVILSYVDRPLSFVRELGLSRLIEALKLYSHKISTI